MLKENKGVAIDMSARIFRRFSVSRRTMIGGFIIQNPTTSTFLVSIFLTF